MMKDPIDRQKAINGADEIIRRDRSGNNDVVKAMTAWKEWVKGLPSIDPKQKTGTWRHYERMLTCSECGTEYYDDIMEYCGDDVPHYCPNCGAEMIGKGRMMEYTIFNLYCDYIRYEKYFSCEECYRYDICKAADEKEDAKLQGLCRRCANRKSCADAKRHLNMNYCNVYKSVD